MKGKLPDSTHTRALELHLLEETDEYKGSSRFGRPLLLIPFGVST